MLARRVLPWVMLAVLGLAGCGRVSGTGASLAVVPARATAGNRQSPAVTDAGMASSAVTGTGSLRGRVIDATTQRPVPGAVVVLEPSGLKLVTDGAGVFQAAQVAAGNYTFKAIAANLKQISTNGVLVENAQTAEVPELTMAPGIGESGIRRVTYRQRAVFAQGEKGAGGLVNPQGLVVQADRVSVLDVNVSTLVHTGSVKEFARPSGRFLGRYGDYSRWLGVTQMRDTVRAIATDVQQRVWVLDSEQKLWRFKPNGTKDRVVDLDIAKATDLGIDPGSGALYVAHPGGVTRLGMEGDAPQPFGQVGSARAVAAIKGGGLWVLAEQQLLQLDARGQILQSLGPSGGDKPDRFVDATDVFYDPVNQFVIVSDAGSKNVYVYDAVGVLIGKVGDGVFQRPVGVTVDGLGHVFVLDAATRAVYEFELVSKQG